MAGPWIDTEEAAAARSFTGAAFRATRPLRETAKLLAKDLRTAMAKGRLPRNLYRVTARKEVWVPDKLVVWMWGRDDAVEETICTMANRYNQCIGRVQWDYYGDYGGSRDTWHFQVYFEEPSAYARTPAAKARMAAFRRGELSYDDLCAASAADRARLFLKDTGRLPPNYD
jgi:hypothetical protein